jgi:hypothetical protein
LLFATVARDNNASASAIAFGLVYPITMLETAIKHESD